MPRIILIRHGIAHDPEPNQDDSERALTADGEQRTAEVARGLAAIDVAPDVILTSPYVRARQTAEILARGLRFRGEVRSYPPLAVGGSSERTVRGLDDYRSAHEIILVGHQPSLGELASYLLTGSSGVVPLPFKKAAAAAIEVSALAPRSAGALLWFMGPRHLRKLGGADRD